MRKKIVAFYSVYVAVAILFLFLLCSASFASPLRASAHSIQGRDGVPIANSYCQLYLENLARRLHISVATLEQNKLAAEEDVLARMVKDGKLTQTQADKMKARYAANAAARLCD